MKALDLINIGFSNLKSKEILSPKLDTELLLAEVLKKTREELLIDLNRKISTKDISQFNELISLRSKKETIDYILKKGILE